MLRRVSRSRDALAVRRLRLYVQRGVSIHDLTGGCDRCGERREENAGMHAGLGRAHPRDTTHVGIDHLPRQFSAVSGGLSTTTSLDLAGWRVSSVDRG